MSLESSASHRSTLTRKLAHLPAKPGVYMLKDKRGDYLYIGKAKSLRARVRNHFALDGAASLKSREMVRRTHDVDTMVVGSEAEALLLEANLIKAHRPRFNIRLRDDKRYPYIKVTVHEPFPRVWVTRRLSNDGSRYFGPYTEVGAMRQALEVIKRLYTVRSCRYDLPREAPARPCLDFHIGRCRAPCVGLQSQDDYRVMVDEMLEVLGGRVSGVRKRVRKEMSGAAKRLEFERAATLRDVLTGLENIERHQRALDIKGRDIDVCGTARDGDIGCAVLLRIRQGKLLGRELDFFDNIADESDAELVSAGATRFYLGRGAHGTADLPHEVLFPTEFGDRVAIESILSSSAGRRVHTHVPARGEKVQLIQLASQNARHLLEERTLLMDTAPVRADDMLYELQEALGLKVVPRLAACFDISHTQGADVVGSTIVFRNGEPDKNEYRRYKIRGDWGNDDVRSMSEVVGRYLSRRLAEERPVPELIVVDGGRGQLNAARAAAAEVGASDIAFVSLAKRDEEVYLPDRPRPLRLARTSSALRLLQRMRDEAHRFAHDYNRRLRGKRTLSSRLSQVPGVGPKRQRALLTKFGSVRAIGHADPEELASVPGVSEALAARVLEHLRSSSDSERGDA